MRQYLVERLLNHGAVRDRIGARESELDACYAKRVTPVKELRRGGQIFDDGLAPVQMRFFVEQDVAQNADGGCIADEVG